MLATCWLSWARSEDRRLSRSGSKSSGSTPTGAANPGVRSTTPGRRARDRRSARGYLVEPVAACCVLAGIGFVALVRASGSRRGRAGVAAALCAVSAPYVLATGAALAHQASEA